MVTASGRWSEKSALAGAVGQPAGDLGGRGSHERDELLDPGVAEAEGRARDRHRGHDVAVGVTHRSGHGGQADVELVDGQSPAVLADRGELLVEDGAVGDRRRCVPDELAEQ